MIKEQFTKAKASLKNTFDRYNSHKFLQWVITIFLLALIITLAAKARTNNIQYLKDSTSGKWIPLDLDSYYFLRIAETMDANGGVLPPTDTMRYPALNLTWAQEALPKVVYNMHKIWQLYDPNVSMAYVDIWYPVIFFVMTLFIFFCLCYILTKSKTLSLIGVAILSVIPPYVYHTILGSTDHESLGMFSFMVMITTFVISMKFFDNITFKPRVSKIFYFLLLLFAFSFSASFVIACWNGIAIFMFMIIPLAYLLIWIANDGGRVEDGSEERNFRKRLWLGTFYIFSYVLIFILVSIWGLSGDIEFRRYSLQPQGLLLPFVAFFILIDLALYRLIEILTRLPRSLYPKSQLGYR
jgi:asparagine N-glycosylation enzyme membrane subunit Stt3